MAIMQMVDKHSKDLPDRKDNAKQLVAKLNTLNVSLEEYWPDSFA